MRARTSPDTETLARGYLKDLGYSMFQLKLKSASTPHGINGTIDNNSFTVYITYDPRWHELFDNARSAHLSKYPKKEEKAILKTFGEPADVLRSVVYHEHGHWRFCPYDITHLETILDGITRGLRDAGKDEATVQTITLDKANEFGDIIVNTCLALENPETKTGRATKYLHEAYVSEERPSLPSSYAAFVDLQMRLYYPEASDIAPTYCENYSEIKPIVDAVLMAFAKKLQRGPALVSGQLTAEERKRILEHLKEPSTWSDLAYIYAKLTACLEPVRNLKKTPFHSKLEKDPDYRAQLIQIALQKGHDPSIYLDPFEVFQQQHRIHGRRIRHDVFEGGQAHAAQLPFAWLTTEPTKLPRHVKWSKTRSDLNNTEEVIFGRKKLPLTKRAGYSLGSLADLLFVCDNSGSMEDKYELLIDTVYAIFEDLRVENKAHLLKYGLIQFSDAKHQSWSGWQDSTEGIERELYKTLKANSWGSHTYLPKDLLQTAYKSNTTLTCISDGEINNPVEAFEGLKSYKGQIVWFQICGEGNDKELPYVPRELQSEGAIVHIVDSIEKLPPSLLTTLHAIYARDKK